MEVKLWTCFLIIHVHLASSIKEGSGNTNHKQHPDDNASVENLKKDTDFDSNLGTLDFLTKNKHQKEHKDYFLPPVFPSNEEDEDEDEDDVPYDYDYDNKELNYKDDAETQTTKADLGSQDVLTFDDKIPIHTAKDNLPYFLLEPENTYVVKNKPATLKCRAANTLEVYFKCNGIKTQALNFEFVDPHTGVRIIEGEYNVTREQVEEYFGTDKYQCSCFAWTSRGHIKSQPAFVDLAYIKKQFIATPQSQLVKQYTQALLRCEPPPAAPFAQLYWLKNGAPMVLDDNVQTPKEGHLLIKQASLLDMANYTCVAENLAGKRISEPALLTVFVNGGWTSWSAWGECSCAGLSQGGRRRVRTCTAPRPLNGGQPCLGPAVQKTADCLDCDLDVYVDGLDELADESSDILLGRWSQWSEWSRCDTDCLQTRRRRCVSSSACLGKDYQVAQCPLCVRTSKSDMINNDAAAAVRQQLRVSRQGRKDYQVAQCPLCVRTSKSDMLSNGSSYWPLLIALSFAVLIFIVVAVLGIKYLKLKMSEPYVKSHPGSNYFGNVIKRTLTNQPDLTIHEEFQTMDSRRTRHLSMSTHRNEHLYEVPQLASSYISPIDQEVRTDHRAESVRTFACKDNTESDRSDSSCFLSSGSSYGNESVEMSPSLKNNVSVNSKTLALNSIETSISKIVTSEGNWLNLQKCGVSLFIPEGTIDKGEELFSIEVTDEEWNRPILQEGETQLSPVIRCGPKSTHFRKSIILCFPHCAALRSGSWLLSILQRPDDHAREWRKVLTLGQESPGAALFAQVDPGKVFLVGEFLSDFVLVGRSFSGLDAKLLKLALFVTKQMEEDSHYTLKIHVLNDTPYAFYDCVETERRLGSTLLCDPKTIYFQENCSDLCFNIREMGVGWKVKSGGKYQELPYNQVWGGNVRDLSCDFVLQHTDAINCLELNLSVYQKQKQANFVNFNFKTNDFNSNFSCNMKRFSTCSADVNNVNILENPFHYSSLSRKEGRYDFVYKNSSNLFRSNFSVDNNYRYNVLTKSDRVILCKLLDGSSPKGNDWRLLAEKLKVDSYYYYFSNTCSPTENVLNLWMCRNNDSNMLVNLARIFREMSRIDCATVVERRCFPN